MSQPEPFNAQNIPEELRVLWVPRRAGNVLVAADAVQIEAALLAYFARDREMTEVALDPKRDLHAINCAAWFGYEDPLRIANETGVALDVVRAQQAELVHTESKAAAKTLQVRFQGKPREARYATKRGTHGVGYGMLWDKMAMTYGWPVEVCKRLIQAWRRRWPASAAWQDALVVEAYERKMLDQSFGRLRYFWAPPPKVSKRTGEANWLRWPDRNEALAYRPASTAASMHKRIVAEMPDELLFALAHDNIVLEVPMEREAATGRMLKAATEQLWPNMVWAPYYPDGFHVRAEITHGRSWGEMEEMTL